MKIDFGQNIWVKLKYEDQALINPSRKETAATIAMIGVVNKDDLPVYPYTWESTKLLFDEPLLNEKLDIYLFYDNLFPLSTLNLD